MTNEDDPSHTDLDVGDDVIVLVRRNGAWQWFVGPKDDWFLDQVKLAKAFEALGYAVPSEPDERCGIAIVNEVTADAFLKCIEGRARDTDELRRVLAARLPATRWDDFHDVVPSLLVDFDERRLTSMYNDPASFEDYVPQGWRGEHGSFLDRVPEALRYWVVDGNDVFAPFIPK